MKSKTYERKQQPFYFYNLYHTNTTICSQKVMVNGTILVFRLDLHYIIYTSCVPSPIGHRFIYLYEKDKKLHTQNTNIIIP